MFEECRNELEGLQEQLNSIRGFLNVPEKQKQHDELEKETEDPGFWSDNERASKIMRELSGIKADIKLYNDITCNISDLETLIEMAEEEQDDSIKQEIDDNIIDLKKRLNKVIFRLKLSGKTDRNDAILTLNAGAGGTEACDWVEMLTRMYQMWASNNGYKTEVLEVQPGDEAGIKRVTFIIEGEYVYGYLKGEVGIHRLVRISPFDSGARRHTSFAACDVIPRIEDDVEININESDLRVDTYRASGHGGQHVNKTDSAVRITHMPSGIVVQCQDSPSQHSNRKKAMIVLKARLYEFEEDKKRASAQKRYDEKGDIGWGNQIRSYVFMPYQMVRDHRTGVKVSKIDAVMDGEIDEFIEAYLEQQA
ncbi:peptide chain release factor 2 [Elusimicrobiota bacterium]